MPDQRSKLLAFAGPWVAYAAALWASVFAVFHIVWAAGWYPLLHAEQARIAFATPWKWAFDVLVAAMCVLAIPVVLAPVMSWGQHLPRRLIWCWRALGRRSSVSPVNGESGSNRLFRLCGSVSIRGHRDLGVVVPPGRDPVRPEHMALDGDSTDASAH